MKKTRSEENYKNAMNRIDAALKISSELKDTLHLGLPMNDNYVNKVKDVLLRLENVLSHEGTGEQK